MQWHSVFSFNVVWSYPSTSSINIFQHHLLIPFEIIFQCFSTSSLHTIFEYRFKSISFISCLLQKLSQFYRGIPLCQSLSLSKAVSRSISKSIVNPISNSIPESIVNLCPSLSISDSRPKSISQDLSISNPCRTWSPSNLSLTKSISLQINISQIQSSLNKSLSHSIPDKNSHAHFHRSRGLPSLGSAISPSHHRG